MKQTIFFISKTKQIYAKTLTVPEITSKIKAMLPLILLETLFTSVVICKQKFSHEIEIELFQNYKYQNANQVYFRKLLQTSTNFVKNNYPTTAYTFLLAAQF